MTAKHGWWILWALWGATSACTTDPVDPCELEAASGYAKDHPACLFYTGTDHYRNGRYSEAHAVWQDLAALPAVADEDRHLVTSAQNNLGYLLFNGQGVAKDRARALELWKSAAAMGHREAEYHLCHGYIDAARPLNDPAAALLHCQKAQSLYEEETERTEAQETVLNDIKKYRAIAEKAVARSARSESPSPADP